MTSSEAPPLSRLRRPLTPAEHAAIRRHLILIPVYIWMVYEWITFLRQLPFNPTNLRRAGENPLVGWPGSTPSIFRDFVHFYILGKIANAHDVQALYDIDQQRVMAKQSIPIFVDAIFPPAHGPQMSVFFAPLSRLPYIQAMWLWLAVTICVYALCGYVIWRLCPRLRQWGWITIVLLATFPGLHFDLMFGQTSAVALVCFTGALLAFRANRPFLAGLAIGWLIYKPQLGVAAAVVFICAGEWRVVIGAIVAAALQLSIGVVYWGAPSLVEYFHALGRISQTLDIIEYSKHEIHSWRSFFLLLHLPPWPVTLLTAIASLVTLVVALKVWRSKAPLAVRYGTLLFATALVDPHFYSYDFIMLTPAFLLLWDWSLSQRGAYAKTIMGLLLYASMSSLLAIFVQLPVQLSVVALALLIALLAASARDSSRSSAAPNWQSIISTGAD